MVLPVLNVASRSYNRSPAEATLPSNAHADHAGTVYPIGWANRAVLLADMVESVRLIEQDEVQTISRWLNIVEHVKADVLPACKGRLVKSLGDGLLMDFSDVRSAVTAAFAIQQMTRRDNDGHMPNEQILLRMGMEVSDVLVEPNDVHGRGVNLAARLMALAGPGEIVISAHARDQLTPALDADVEDLGDCFLRHVSQPVRAYRIGPPGARPSPRSAPKLDELAPTIAVVPFAAHHTGPEHQVIGEILAEEIIRALSHAPDLSVISRLSTTALRGRAMMPAEIGAHLRADYVLAGRYTCDAANVTLSAELAEAQSGRILRSERITDKISGVLSGEQALVSRLVAEIGNAMVMRELQRSKLQPLPTLKAYTLLMSAIALMHRLSVQDFDQARQLLQTLIDRSARQPVPQAWLANWHVLRVQQGWSVDPRQDAYLALECTKRALDVDPHCSLALAVDGFVHTNLLKKLDVAQDRYSRAISANPSNALAWLLHGMLHAFMGDGPTAVDSTQRALKLTPLDPHRYFYDSLAASACFAAGRDDDALALAQASLRANRKHTSTLRVLAVTQARLGQHEAARKTAQELMTLEPGLTVHGWLERSPAAAYPIGQEFASLLREVGVPQ
jgi:adenylate cyclase